MRSLCRTLLLITWALWFGGVTGLFLSVQALFHQTERPVFLESAPHLFFAFERYQLILAAMTLLLTFGSRMLVASRRQTLLFVLFAIATLCAVIETTVITPRIDALRIKGATHSPEFLRLHGISMCVYMLIAIMLLIAGVMQSLCLEAPHVHAGLREPAEN